MLQETVLIDPITGQPYKASGAVTLPTSLETPQYKAADTAAHQITSTSTPLLAGAQFIAPSTNAGVICIGDNASITATIDGTGNALPVLPGAAVFIPMDNLNRFYAIAANANDVLWIGAN